MRAFPFLALGAATLLALNVAACGNADSNGSETRTPASNTATTADGGLTPEQTKNGIGPIKHVSISDTIGEDLAERGEEIFKMKCAACHKMDIRYVGPPLRDVVVRRSPEYIMNMLLNTQEMIEKHPAAKELLAQYMTPMPNQNLTEEDARALLEHLRHEHEEGSDQ